ncbi:MAG: AAA family ATPase [Mollicutes bacterium PWAP]|nr:AAA family ATPase [Mollicutes bacterium PWAP]
MDFNFTPAKDSKNVFKDFTRNLTDEAIKNKIDPIIGRNEEIRRIIRILSRKNKNNPMLVGEPGVGKTAIVEGLAQRIVSGQVPENMKDMELLELDVSSMLAGAQYQGMFEKRMKDILKEIKKSNGNIILFVDEFHTLIGTGKNQQGGLDAAQMLKPMLARGELKLIGATTFFEHKKYIESDAAFERRMQKVIVNEPSEKESIAILRGIKSRYETYHSVTIKDESIISAVKLSKRYINNRFLPDKAIDLMDEAASIIQTEINSAPEILEKKIQELNIIQIELAALKKEIDSKSLKRIVDLKKIQLKLSSETKELQSKWDKEKNSNELITSYKKIIEKLNHKATNYQSHGEFEKASKIIYKEIPEIEKLLKIAIEKNNSDEKSLFKDKVTVNEIAQVVSKWVNIPIENLLENENDKLLHLEKELLKNIKGQDNAVESVSNAMLRSATGVSNEDSPIASFLFYGPTGVGKTKLAQELSKLQFGSIDNMIRIDMSEYVEKNTISKLIGSPPGYEGSENGGLLTEKIRNNPYSVVLIDELEKAHPEVINIFLQIMDNGNLRDSRGIGINFRNTILIFTSNVGGKEILLEKVSEANKKLKEVFNLEILNRFDETIVFNKLNEENIKEIVLIELNKFKKQLIEKDIYVKFSDEIIDHISTTAYSNIFGARPIKHWINKHLRTFLGKTIIKKEILKEVTQIITIKENKIKFQKNIIN